MSILGLTKLIGLLSSAIQTVLPAQINFKYLQQQQLQALKTQRSYCKKVILNRISEVKLQWTTVLQRIFSEVQVLMLL